MSLAASLLQWWQAAVRTARLAVGIGDYETYRAHLREHHPERQPMSREDYFRDRLSSRYARGRSRCC